MVFVLVWLCEEKINLGAIHWSWDRELSVAETHATHDGSNSNAV